MIKRSLYFPNWLLQTIIPISVFAPLCYAGAMKMIPAFLFIMTIPVAGRITGYFFKKYYASNLSLVDRVGDNLIIKGVFFRLAIDINIVKSININHNFFSRSLNIKLLTVQTTHQGQIRILISEEAAEQLTATMA